jgi:DNA-directed RNA polymerase specialized sigma24 family protein
MLVHEAYLNMCERGSAAFADRANFLAYAARAMRASSSTYLRSDQAQKRGGEFEITSLPAELPQPQRECGDIEVERRARPSRGSRSAPRRCVDLKFFGGFSFVDIAAMRSVTENARCAATGKRRATCCTS